MISLRVPGTFSYKHLKFQKFNTFNFNFSMLLLLTILPPVMDGPRVHTSFSLDKRRSDRRALALRSSINDGGTVFQDPWLTTVYLPWLDPTFTNMNGWFLWFEWSHGSYDNWRLEDLLRIVLDKGTGGGFLQDLRRMWTKDIHRNQYVELETLGYPGMKLMFYWASIHTYTYIWGVS